MDESTDLQPRHIRAESRADNAEKRWTDRDVLALLRATTPPAYVLDRMADMLTESRKTR